MKTYDIESYIKICEIPKSEIDRIDFAKCKEPRQTLKSYYDDCKVKPDLVCNGGFFNMASGESVFNFKDDGKNHKR